MDSMQGKQLNGTARDLEIYLMDTTLRVTLFGWALQIPRADVQDVANRFYEQVTSMMNAARSKGQYPVNAAIEIRCTTVDHETALKTPGAPPPTLAATHSVDPQNAALDTVIWLNVGAVPGTPGANEFYTELEQWFIATWGGATPNPLRPEWSKAFAWSAEGPWRNAATLAWIRNAYDQSNDRAPDLPERGDHTGQPRRRQPVHEPVPRELFA